MGLLYYVSYATLLSAFAFVTLSLASGLLYISELIEEYSRLAKTVGQRSIYVIIALHVVFYITDSLPFLQTLFSIFCHVVYLGNFSHTWPLISLTSLTFLSSCVLVIVDHFLWFFYFSRITTDARHLRTYKGITTPVPGFAEIASFFGICVWFAPLFLFLSLSANDNALPTAAEPRSPTIASASIQTGQNRVSLLRSTLSFVAFDSLPRIRPQRKDTSEGLIAPRSPMPIRTPLPRLPSSPSLRPVQFTIPPPPRSPGPRGQEVDLNTSPPLKSGFKLDAPPTRRYASEGIGLGLRRPATTSNDDS